MSEPDPAAPGTVRYESADHVATITIDRPWAHNAMTEEMYQQLVACCETAEADRSIRVTVLRGAGGRAFASGSDIRGFLRFTSGDDGLAYEQRIASYFAHVERLRMPTVAVIEGYAVGGGMGLALACDLRVCTPRARFGLPIAKTLGNAVSIAAYARLAELVGSGRATQMLFLATLMDAADAADAGLVTAVVAEDELDAHVRDLTATIASHAPVTLEVTKEAYRRIREHALPADDDLLRRAYGTEDFREGVHAYLEKRRPEWSGA